ncbi:MAG: HEAT repeat domain-containing protein [Proteobacteria bacterium]|jgi:HEAT repeat protein|nr:HEAT repeat domain-containing protein [Pseudomonadota bacterium]
MGILEYFSSEQRRRRRIDARVRRANNKHTPKDYRQIALQEVIDFAKAGEVAAVRGLIHRFTVNAEPTIEDEREKEWVSSALTDLGRTTLPEISRALRSAESVVWIQRVYRSIASPEEYRDELLSVLSEFDTEYERNPDRKMQTIMALADIPETRVAQALIPFLEDVDETVRFQTVVALAKIGHEAARAPMLKAMCEDESLRVRNEVVEAFAALAWSTAGYKKKIDDFLPRGYRHDKSGKIVKLGSV